MASLRVELETYTSLVTKDLDGLYKNTSNTLVMTQKQLMDIEKEERQIAARKAMVLETVQKLETNKSQLGAMIALRERLRVLLESGKSVTSE